MSIKPGHCLKSFHNFYGISLKALPDNLTQVTYITTHQEKIISKQLLIVACIPAMDIPCLYTLLKNLLLQSDHSRVIVLLL